VTEIIQPGEIRPPSEEAPFVRLADRNYSFRRRAERFLELAEGHPLEPFLLFMAQLAQVQQEALDALNAAMASSPALEGPESTLPLGKYREQGVAVFPATDGVDPRWRDILNTVLEGMQDSAPAPTRKAIRSLQSMLPETLDALAGTILLGQHERLDPAQAPLVAAALQVWWTHLATTLDASAFGTVQSAPEAVPGHCPVCGSPPVSGIVHIGGLQQGLRYLHCSLCETEWHLVRVKCSNCSSTIGIEYLGVEEDNGAVKAETCGECHTYLKILYMDKDPRVDAIADDLASLGLDLLVSEEGYLRNGPNPFFVPGEEKATAN
jgi:FdhE protein